MRALARDVAATVRALRELPLDLDLDVCEQVWKSALSLPAAHAASNPQWLHGDLTGENPPYYWRTMPGRCAARLATERAVVADAA